MTTGRMPNAFTCPYCLETVVICQEPGCEEVSVVEAWVGYDFIRLRKLCYEHAQQNAVKREQWKERKQLQGKEE